MAKARSNTERVARTLAALGVPVSQQAALVGVHYSEVKTSEQVSRQSALLRLAMVYDAVARDARRCFGEVADAYDAAAALGVDYLPEGAVQARVADRAAWMRRCRARAEASQLTEGL